MEAFTVLPGEKFYVDYISDGVVNDFAVPDLEATTTDVFVFLNGIIQPPFTAYTVHQGNMRFTGAPVPNNYLVAIRS